MGDIYIALGNGGGVSSDEVTTASSHVLKGKTYVGADTDDEIGIGTMPNNPAQIVTLNCGQSITIPLGYNPGSKITANSLASQTGGVTADDSKVLSSYTYWKDGVKRTGNLTIQSVVSFNVGQYSNLTLIASWAKPAKGPWSGVRILCKQGGYPSNVNDGTLFYEGSGTFATKALVAGTWYFRAWNYITTNNGRFYGNYIEKAVTNNQVRGQQTFTSSGTFKVPANVYKIEVFCVGGGGHGQDGRKGSSNGGCNPAGGAGGGYTNTGSYSVSPGQSFSVIIGAGGGSGGGASSEGGAGYKGGTTSVSGLINAAGGNFLGQGGSGGSGGGESGSDVGHNGGSDGSNGGGYYGGIGQGRTTRAFGESTGTLYAGGGGGGSYYGTDGTGGAGGGGNAGRYGHGSANTGGGGGGGTAAFYEPEAKGGDGGSGIAIIRWGYKSGNY